MVFYSDGLERVAAQGRRQLADDAAADERHTVDLLFEQTVTRLIAQGTPHFSMITLELLMIGGLGLFAIHIAGIII